MTNWTSIESQKGVTVVTAWPVNHLQSAVFLCSLLDASRLGPSPRGASKHSEATKSRAEVLRLMFWKLCRRRPFGFDFGSGRRDSVFRRENTRCSPSCNKINPHNYDRTLASCCTPCSLHLRRRHRRHVFLTTEAPNEMPTLRGDGHLNANAPHV